RSAAGVAGTERPQHPEAVDARAVPVRPRGGERVVAHTLDVDDVLAGEVEVARGGGVPLAGGAGTPAPEVIEREGRDVAVVPHDHEPARAHLVTDLDGLGIVAGHGRGRGRR